MSNEIVSFPVGKVVCSRWQVVKKLGNGGCGAVYKVEDLKRKGFTAALKAEGIREGDNGGVLKLEAGVLRRFNNADHVIKLLDSGKRMSYNFIVISLCGADLFTLKNKAKDGAISDASTLRIGVQALYAIKQLHELGYVHRDVKPGNIMNGVVGREKRMFFLIDFGMARSLLDRNKSSKGNAVLRTQRPGILLRGTLRYCSLNVHKRCEQGRVDDLWALLYTLTELFAGVPWRTTRDEEEIKKMKKWGDDVVFKDCPKSFPIMATYLRKLHYADRPDYFKIYKLLMDEIVENNYSFHEAYEWEPEEEEAGEKLLSAVELSEREKKSLKPLEQLEFEYKLYPNIHPSHFKSKVLGI